MTTLFIFNANLLFQRELSWGKNIFRAAQFRKSRRESQLQGNLMKFNFVESTTLLLCIRSHGATLILLSWWADRAERFRCVHAHVCMFCINTPYAFLLSSSSPSSSSFSWSSLLCHYYCYYYYCPLHLQYSKGYLHYLQYLPYIKCSCYAIYKNWSLHHFRDKTHFAFNVN